jgi:hypothetical protein
LKLQKRAQRHMLRRLMQRTKVHSIRAFFSVAARKKLYVSFETISRGLDPGGASPSNFLKIMRWSYIASRRSVLASQLQAAKTRQ